MSVSFRVVKSTFHIGKFFVRTLTGKKRNLKTALREITGETALTESELQGTVVALARHRDEALLRGQVVDYGPLGTYSIRVKASLDEYDQPLPEDAEMRVKHTLPQSIIQALKDQVEYVRESRAPSQPVISTFVNIATEQKNSFYTPSTPARLVGDFLNFDRDDQEQGVFFVSDGNPAVRSDIYVTTGKKNIVFNIPNGLVGIQAVEVRTRRKDMGAVLSSELLGPLEPAA